MPKTLVSIGEQLAQPNADLCKSTQVLNYMGGHVLLQFLRVGTLPLASGEVLVDSGMQTSHLKVKAPPPSLSLSFFLSGSF